MIVLVDTPFRPYIQTAIQRLLYLYPAIRFEATPGGISVGDDSGIASDSLVRDIRYTLYREKIYAETLPMRCALVEVVTRR